MLTNRGRRSRLLGFASITAVGALALGACGSSSGSGDDSVTIEFSQWWAVEMPEGALEEIVADYEDENPNVQVELVSSPYSSQQQQVTSDAAVGTLPDVVGLDGAWIYDLNEQSALVPLDDYIEDSDIDESDLANVVSVNDETLMISAVNFTHPLFVNTDLLAKAGIDHAPQTREEFKNIRINKQR